MDESVEMRSLGLAKPPASHIATLSLASYLSRRSRTRYSRSTTCWAACHYHHGRDGHCLAGGSPRNATDPIRTRLRSCYVVHRYRELQSRMQRHPAMSISGSRRSNLSTLSMHPYFAALAGQMKTPSLSLASWPSSNRTTWTWWCLVGTAKHLLVRR